MSAGNPGDGSGGGGEPVRLEISGDVATITLDRPENRNALSAELVGRLCDHLGTAMSDDAVRVVVLTNTGTTFCAGADLSAERPGPGTAGGNGRDFTDVFRLVLDGPKPVVGRIAGHCTGGGVGLAAACDLSVIVEDAIVGFTEVRIGVAPAVISVVCLPKLSRADAAELFLTGRRLPAARAVEVGLLTRAVPAGQLDATVEGVIDELRRGAPGAMAATKELIARVPSMARDEAFAWTAERSAALFAGEEATAGIAAFRQRREPPWVTS